jgi:uncharacterized membrane protein
MRSIKIIPILFLIVFFVGNVSAGEYIFAEVEIQDNGIVYIQGDSDVDPGIAGMEFLEGKISGETQLLTTKENGVWRFFINIGETYSEIYLRIYFPDNTESIQGIVTDLDVQLNIDGQTYLEVVDSDKSVEFSAEYVITRSNNNGWIFILILGIVIAGLVVYIIMRKKPNKFDMISDLLSEKENEIVKLLMKKSMRQNEIRKKLDIPKASFSRYMINMEKKKVIVRDGEGRNKIVRLK